MDDVRDDMIAHMEGHGAGLDGADNVVIRC
jgi:hypothetical protein